jgi:hypothetical protein
MQTQVGFPHTARRQRVTAALSVIAAVLGRNFPTCTFFQRDECLFVASKATKSMLENTAAGARRLLGLTMISYKPGEENNVACRALRGQSAVAVVVWLILYGRGVVFRFAGVYITPGIFSAAAMVRVLS